MSRLKWIGAGVAVLAVGVFVSGQMGSRPEAPTGGPLDACGADPNCARVRVSVDAAPDAVRASARQALAETGATEITETGDGWSAEARIGPFTDDVQVGVEPDGDGSILWIRSASRTGRSDLGVNARRVARLTEATRRGATG